MRRLIFCLVISLSFPLGFSFAQSNQTESLTITTYYPAPYGVYRNLKLNPSNEPTTGVDRGVMYYDNSTNVLKYRNDTGWVNISSGSAGSASACVTNTCSYWSTHPCTATCSSGYYATGGGANGNAAELTETRPSGNDGWYCRGSSGVSYAGTCYVRCCP